MLLLTAALSLQTAHAAPLTAAEVARHDSPGDCWMIIDGIVYDVTGFLEAHPGGEAIARGCGKDATGFFTHRDEAGGHSEQAVALLASLRIGALGDDLDGLTAPTPPHPFDLTADGRRVGLLGSAAVAPRKSIDLSVSHRLSTDAAHPSVVAVDIGLGMGVFDVHLWDAAGEDVSGLEVKVAALRQHGPRRHPLSLAIQGGAGFFRDDGPPGAFGQLTAERTLLDRRLSLRAGSVVALREGVDVAAGGGLELRPIPIHGLFVEVLAPLTAEAPLAWAAGARIYTRGHHFSLYASSTPTTAQPLLVAPAQALSIGFGLERAIRL
jgi:hypothetical protein